MTREAGIVEFFHRMTEDEPQTCFVIDSWCPQKRAWDEFFDNAGEEVAKSGQNLESTEVTMLSN